MRRANTRRRKSSLYLSIWKFRSYRSKLAECFIFVTEAFSLELLIALFTNRFFSSLAKILIEYLIYDRIQKANRFLFRAFYTVSSMQKTLTLFEHEYTTGNGWTDSEAKKIFQLNGYLDRDVLLPTFKVGNRELKATEQVGVVRYGKRTVQILPKIYNPSSQFSDVNREEIARQASENLLYLLALVTHFSVRESEIAALARNSSDWFEILIQLFAKHLFAEWTRGAVHNYQIVEAETGILKGKWQIAHQSRRPASRHIFSVAFDEFTADNPLNRVFRFVVERLWRVTGSLGNRRLLSDLRMLMDEVTLLAHISVREADSSLLNRTNSRFSPLLNMARLFLEGGTLKLSAGADDSFAFVFDMNALFETFLSEFIRRHREGILPVDLRNCDILAQTQNATRYLAMCSERSVFRLKPDLSFRQPDGSFPLIVDAKYKRLSKNNSRLDVAPADFYQMHAYAHRYECPRIVLIYPQTAETRKGLRAHFQLQQSKVIIQAATVNMQRHLIQKSEQRELVAELKGIFSETI